MDMDMLLEAARPYVPKSSEAYDKATAEGLIVDLPQDNELLLDLDTHEAVTRFKTKLLPLLTQYYGIELERVLITRSKSKGWHARVAFHSRKLSAVERVAFQAACGSDPVRELLSLVMIDTQDPQPTLLHEQPATMERIIAWRKSLVPTALTEELL